jgi:hypothetical protein
MSRASSQECWFEEADRVSLRRAAEAAGSAPIEVAAAPDLRTRGELSLVVHALVPEILRAQRDEALCEIAARLERAPLESTADVLYEAAARLGDARAEAEVPTNTCDAAECARSPGSTSCLEARATRGASRRATALRAVEAAALAVQVAFTGPFECATGWPDYLLEWSWEALPLAAVAAGVDPERVVRLVLRSIAEIDAEPLTPQSPGRG